MMPNSDLYLEYRDMSEDENSAAEQKSTAKGIFDSAIILAILTTIVFVWGLAYMKGYSSVYGLPLYEFSLSTSMTVVANHWIDVSTTATIVGLILILMRASPKYLRRRKSKVALLLTELCEGETPEAKSAYLVACFVLLYITGLIFQQKGFSNGLKYGTAAPVVALSGNKESLPDGAKLLSMDSESYYFFHGEVSAEKRPTIIVLNRADVGKLQFTR